MSGVNVQLGRLPVALAAWEAALCGPRALPYTPLEVAEALKTALLARGCGVRAAYGAAGAVAGALSEAERRRATGGADG